jgi:DtxR family Mn-dependent transcriptional regulator
MVTHWRHTGPHSTESVEEYLEALSRLQEKGEKLSTTNIAEKLDVSPASVSEMLKKLDREGYIRYKPYKHIEMTPKGKRAGGKVLGRHRLLERFLRHMGMHRHMVHDEACRLEHHVSDEFEDIIKRSMGPAKRKGMLSLVEMRSGEHGELVDIEGGARSAKRLEEMGLTPGVSITVTRSAPFSGPVEISVRDSCLVIGRGMASKVFVRVGR